MQRWDKRLCDGRPLVIRSANQADAPTIFQFLKRVAIETDFADFTPDEFDYSEAAAQYFIRESEQAENQLFLLALIDHVLVGTLTFSGGRWSRNRHAGEFGMSVLKMVWSRGVGTALVETLVEWAQAGGVVKKINLRVRSDNTRAIDLYLRHGFQREGILLGDMFVRGQYFDHWCMGRMLE